MVAGSAMKSHGSPVGTTFVVNSNCESVSKKFLLCLRSSWIMDNLLLFLYAVRQYICTNEDYNEGQNTTIRHLKNSFTLLIFFLSSLLTFKGTTIQISPPGSAGNGSQSPRWSRMLSENQYEMYSAIISLY